MVEQELNVYSTNDKIPEKFLREFSILLKQKGIAGCHSYKGGMGKYQNWAQKKDEKNKIYTVSMAYDIEGENHFVFIIKFDGRYDEKMI